MNYILDTNMVIFAMQKGDPKRVRQKIASHSGDLFISSITYDELMFGVYNSDSEKRKQTKIAMLNEFLMRVTILPFDEKAADHSANIRQHLYATGLQIGGYDNLIAGHTRSLGMTCVTNNTREFTRVPSLSIEDWTNEKKAH
ncbi:type II toxin-antitoxin system VapC family toxin [Endozoicomonas sp. YOMI1]|uniref:type II toxin-antitoxin system VapC family toxin n=1 Tax=Endozoicomonas sp. YOMI1 TaxID=2828739 RepID=UPI0021496DD8|nr:type II toxin-antitoxin system VapC family toxin [Endozoicomonas sp. YOMI1]